MNLALKMVSSLRAQYLSHCVHFVNHSHPEMYGAKTLFLYFGLGANPTGIAILYLLGGVILPASGQLNLLGGGSLNVTRRLYFVAVCGSSSGIWWFRFQCVFFFVLESF